MPQARRGFIFAGAVELRNRACEPLAAVTQGTPAILTSPSNRFSYCKRSQTAQTAIGGDSLCQLRATREERQERSDAAKGGNHWRATNGAVTETLAYRRWSRWSSLNRYISRASIWTISGSCCSRVVSLEPPTCIWPALRVRLFLNDDRAAIYSEYGLEDTEV